MQADLDRHNGQIFRRVAPAHRLWTAELAIDFDRLKDDAPDLRFTEQFTWRAGRFEVSTDFAADESVLDYAIVIAPCTCRE